MAFSTELLTIKSLLWLACMDGVNRDGGDLGLLMANHWVEKAAEERASRPKRSTTAHL
jgi:hypothetical protein